MKNKGYTQATFHQCAPHALQVAVDHAIEGHYHEPENVGFYWVKPFLAGELFEIDRLVGSGAALLPVGGDMSKLDPTLIPSGGVVCPPGKFWMGNPNASTANWINERVHEVTLTRPFGLGRFPVTRDLYTAVSDARPWKDTGEKFSIRCPATYISFLDACLFCNRLSELLGLEPVYDETGIYPIPWHPERNGFRLPTEAEWEYAARGGEDFQYAGSDDIDEVGWCVENARRTLMEVGQKKPNALGLYDMSGLVLEWCQDMEADYRGEPVVDPVVSGTRSSRILRGGSIQTTARDCAVFIRNGAVHHYTIPHAGFRLCRTLQERP